MVKIDIDMPKSCADCTIRKNIGCRIANESGWLNNRRDERCFLKSDDPQVLTLREATEYADVGYEVSDKAPLYVEYYKPVPEWVKWLTANALKLRLFGGVQECDTYGKLCSMGWRCWTSRPTDEQRKAVPWND